MFLPQPGDLPEGSENCSAEELMVLGVICRVRPWQETSWRFVDQACKVLHGLGFEETRGSLNKLMEKGLVVPSVVSALNTDYNAKTRIEVLRPGNHATSKMTPEKGELYRITPTSIEYEREDLENGLRLMYEHIANKDKDFCIEALPEYRSLFESFAAGG